MAVFERSISFEKMSSLLFSADILQQETMETVAKLRHVLADGHVEAVGQVGAIQDPVRSHPIWVDFALVVWHHCWS